MVQQKVYQAKLLAIQVKQRTQVESRKTQGSTGPACLSCGHIPVPVGVYSVSVSNLRYLCMLAAKALNEVWQCAGRRLCNPEEARLNPRDRSHAINYRAIRTRCNEVQNTVVM